MPTAISSATSLSWPAASHQLQPATTRTAEEVMRIQVGMRCDWSAPGAPKMNPPKSNSAHSTSKASSHVRIGPATGKVIRWVLLKR
ncbi:MAG: hypothetical protein IPO15_16160 [Anaerolineae bacterium]|uniref:hypothetical protein n=1 Tax=Candidatus Amarolinea dominans TaxID=3140696 RepID=UPI003134EA65|nr:hypothetical protein [Anaerolineae bacterium]